jgi:hypothetical protein
LYFGRFSGVHIGGPSSNQATSNESQMIHPIQLLPGRTLSVSDDGDGLLSEPVEEQAYAARVRGAQKLVFIFPQPLSAA